MNHIFIFVLSVHLKSKSHFQIIQSLFNVTASINEHRGTRAVARNKTLELQRECDYSYCRISRQLRGGGGLNDTDINLDAFKCFFGTVRHKLLRQFREQCRYNSTNFVHKVSRLVQYPDLGKCWAFLGKYILKVFFTDTVSELYGQRLYKVDPIPIGLTYGAEHYSRGHSIVSQHFMESEG
jgi:hypothetical protein